jgi:DNA replicative helicase MCM subunit Mcm2 (Cdc46/Mcm family)
MIEYLESNHKEQVIDILNAESLAEIPFPAIEVNLVKLKEENKKLFDKVVYRDNIWSEQIKWTESLELTQKKILDTFEGHSKEYSFVKNLFPVTFINHPSPGLSWSHDKIFELVEVTANVIKTSDLRKKEAHREYRCTKCKETTTIEANRHHDFYFEELNKCTISRGCTGTMINTAANDEELDLDRYIDFQIILVKTLLSSSSKGEDLKVELDEEYTDKCRVGDQVTILGVIETRSEFGMNSFKLVLRAASLKVHQVGQSYTSTDLFEINCEIYDMWDKDKNKYNGDEAVIRDEMVSSVAPELQGLAMIKFGLLLTLCSGGSDDQNESPQTQGRQNIKFREICHLLMIGDPGLGKSQILRAACNISLISQQTVGYSATAAGLIGGIYKEDGNDHVEGGALVKANNGICAIDEFNLMPKEHRSSIHEAMEHQVVSFKKGNLDK